MNLLTMNTATGVENTIPTDDAKLKDISKVEDATNNNVNKEPAVVPLEGAEPDSKSKIDNDKLAALSPSKAEGKDGKKMGEGDDDVTMTFPQRLMDILCNEEHAEIISWLPHGRGFMIYKKKQFETDVMPHYFNKHSKYTSFTRKLNRWGFVRVTRGPEMGAYYHKFFKRGEGRLCMQMSCQRPSGIGIEGFAGTNEAQSDAPAQQMANQQQQQHQANFNPGAMQGGPGQASFLQMHQQQHMQLLMRHREQMLQREAAMMRAGQVGGGSQNSAMMQQMGGPMNHPMGMNPQMMKQAALSGGGGAGGQGMVPPGQAGMMMAGMMGMNPQNMGMGGHYPPNMM